MSVGPIPASPGASDDGRWTPLRIITIAIAVAIMTLDGFDVLTAAYTVPVIAREWSLSPDQAGLLLSCGLTGVAIGTMALSSLADIFGRRRVVIFWVIVVGLAMCAASLATNLWMLVVARVIAGLGIGALSPGLAVLAAETAPLRHRDLVLGLITASYPAGAILGGVVAVPILEAHGWQAVYLLGGISAAVILPFALIWLPESVDILRRRGTPTALAKAERLFVQLDMPRHDRAPQQGPGMWNALLETLKPPLRNRMLVLVACYTACLAPMYFINTWSPKLATGFGMSDSQAISVSIMQSIGSVLGGLFTGLLTARLGRGRLALLALGSFTLFLCTFPFVGQHLGLSALRVHGVLFGIAMFCSGIGIFAMILEACPEGARATSLGLATGLARIAASAGPYAGGVMLATGLVPWTVCIAMALPVVLAAFALTRLNRQS